jgi:hypothetical protein
VDANFGRKLSLKASTVNLNSQIPTAFGDFLAFPACVSSANRSLGTGGGIQHKSLWVQGWILASTALVAKYGCKHETELRSPEIIGKNNYFHHFILSILNYFVYENMQRNA